MIQKCKKKASQMMQNEIFDDGNKQSPRDSISMEEIQTLESLLQVNDFEVKFNKEKEKNKILEEENRTLKKRLEQFGDLEHFVQESKENLRRLKKERKALEIMTSCSSTRPATTINEDDNDDDDDLNEQLNYKKDHPNIVELVPGSNIYLPKIEFIQVKNFCKTDTQLARNLLTVIFKLDALLTCSVCGKAPRVAKKPDVIRSLLHPRAVKTILEFVAFHFDISKTSHLVSSMGVRLSELRKEHNTYI